MKAPDTLECKDDIVRTWAYLLESMDLPCKECPVYGICLQMEKRCSCYSALNQAVKLIKELETKGEVT